MTAILAPNPRWQGRNAIGQPIVGGLLYTYVNNTLTPKPTFQDYLETIPNTNPVELDSKGEANIYWSDDELYTIKLFTSIDNAGLIPDQLVTTQDNYPVTLSAVEPVTIVENSDNYARNPQFAFWNNTPTFPLISRSLSRYDNVADDWTFERNNLNASINVMRGTFSLGQTEVAATPTYYLDYECTAVGSGAETYKFFGQYYDSVQTLSGETVSVAFYAKSQTSSTVSLALTQYFGSGGSPSSDVTTTLITQALTPTWTRYTATFSLPSVIGKTLGSNGDDALILKLTLPLNQISHIQFANIQLHNLDEIISFPSSSPDDQFKRLNSQIDNGVAKTGDFKMTLRDAADHGWIMANDNTLGDSASGADQAGIFAKSLFELIWNKVANAYAPIFDSSGIPTSRGASAEQDYNANKQLSLTKTLGRILATAGHASLSDDFTANTSTDALAIADSSSFYTGTPVVLTTSGTLPAPLSTAVTYYVINSDATHIKLSTTLANAIAGIFIDITTTGTGTHTVSIDYSNWAIGQYTGESTHAQTIAEIAAHQHGSPDGNDFATRDAGSSQGVVAGFGIQLTTANVTASAGGSTAMNNMQPTVFLSCMIKL